MMKPAAREVATPHQSARAARRACPAPMFWATKADMDCMIWPPVDTAEMSTAVPKRPTTCKSTAPYMA